MRKTRDLFKKIRNAKGTFHAKISTIKDRNGRDLTEAEDIKKRWQEYTEELDVNVSVLHMVVYICQCYFPNLSYPFLLLLCPQSIPAISADV